MTAPTSRGRKLLSDGDFVLPPLSGTPLPERTFTSVYHDTGDLRLLNAGIVLCRRAEADHARWQLRLPRDHRQLRVEIAADDTEVPEQIAALLLVHTRGSGLRAVASLRTTRTSLSVKDGGVHVADIISSRVEVLDGDQVTACVGDIEIEPVDGDDQAIDAVEQRLREAGAGDADRRSRLQRALGLEPDAPAPADGPQFPAERLQAMVAAQYRQILLTDPGTRLGEDPEHLHQHRVAVRRLRSVLRAARPMLDPEWTQTIRDELGWAGRGLGAVRDLDVLLERVRDELAELPGDGPHDGKPLLDALEAERREARAEMLAELSSQRYFDLIDLLAEAAVNLPVVHEDTPLVKFAEREYRKLRKASRRLGALPTDADLHAARIQAKRLRYTAETAADVDGAHLKPVIKQAKRLQTILGEHQDAHVAEERLRALLDDRELPVATRLAGSRLIERERMRRRAIRKALPPEWKELRSAARKVF